MIKIEKTEVYGWEAAIRGMRNPMNSWGKSDSGYKPVKISPINDIRVMHVVGNRDLSLMKKLADGGSVHAKYRRMITVTADITAPLYWWKEFDTYKVGTVANSCSTMHKLADKDFTMDDFSWEKLLTPQTCANGEYITVNGYDGYDPGSLLSEIIIPALNLYRKLYLKTNDKKYWWQMIQLLPSSYNQKRTVQLNYEVLAGMYRYRKNHKLDEWRNLCEWIQTLPYSGIITDGTDERSTCDTRMSGGKC